MTAFGTGVVAIGTDFNSNGNITLSSGAGAGGKHNIRIRF